MFIINVADPFTLLLILIITVLLIFLGKEIKKPAIPAIALIAFLVLVVIHCIQLGLSIGENYDIIIRCITVDAVMILLTFFSYLWIDDIACKFYKKKSIDNSLDWFWKEI